MSFLVCIMEFMIFQFLTTYKKLCMPMQVNRVSDKDSERASLRTHAPASAMAHLE